MSQRRRMWIIFLAGIIVLGLVFVLIRFPGITLEGFLVLPIYFLLWLANQFYPMCVYDDPVIRLASPDRKVEALVWHRDCGATTATTFTTALARFGDKDSEVADVFAADYTIICALYWLSPDHLVMEMAYGTNFMGIRSTIPNSDIFNEPEKPGAIEFELRKVPYSERCTLGMPWEIKEELAHEFLTTPGFPMHKPYVPPPEKKKKIKRKTAATSSSITATGS